MSLALLCAALYALFVWWFSTGLVMWVVGLPRRTHPWSLLFVTLLMVASLFGLSAAADDPGAGGAYWAFTCAVLIWAWQEVGFLMGIVTGPRRTALTSGARGMTRLSQAIGTILHHELALLVSGAAVFAVSFGAENQVGLWTFAILWVMRLSAKLNLFLGVPNRGEEFLPDHLRYLASYFAHRPMNFLFPVSVTGATIVAALLGWQALDGPESAAGPALLVALLALAILEHWFLVLPLPSIALWRWGLTSRERTAGEPASAELRPPRGGWRTSRPIPQPLAAVPAAGAVNEHAVTSHRRGP